MPVNPTDKPIAALREETIDQDLPEVPAPASVFRVVHRETPGVDSVDLASLGLLHRWADSRVSCNAASTAASRSSSDRIRSVVQAR